MLDCFDLFCKKKKKFLFADKNEKHCRLRKKRFEQYFILPRKERKKIRYKKVCLLSVLLIIMIIRFMKSGIFYNFLMIFYHAVLAKYLFLIFLTFSTTTKWNWKD